MNRYVLGLSASLAIWLTAPALAQIELGTSFTHQGSLRDAGSPASGLYDFQFSLYNALNGGTQIAGPVSREDVQVTEGVYSVTLDFGDEFTGDERYIEIQVRRANAPSLTTLTPRQRVSPVPYSIFSKTSGVAAEAEMVRSEFANIGESSGNPGVGTAELYGVNDTINVRITSDERNDNHGEITVHNSSGEEKVEIDSVEDDDIGLIRTRGNNDSDNVIISTTVGVDNHGRITLFDEESDEAVLLLSEEDEGGRLILRSQDNVAGIDVRADDEDGGRIDVLSPDGDSLVNLRYADNNDSDLDGSGVFLFTPSGSDAGDFRSFDGFGGRLLVRSASGGLNAVVESASVNNNHGFIAVFDSGGDSEAGLVVDSNGLGLAFADDFVVTSKASNKSDGFYQYSSLTGNESALYSRGKITMENGQATIPFDQAFLELADPDTITVHLTPYSKDSGGVAVSSINKTNVQISDLLGKINSYDVGYLLIAERSDRKDFQKNIVTKDGRHPFDNHTKERAGEKTDNNSYVPFEGESVK